VRRLSRTCQEAWTGFARRGDPNHGALPDWPGYDTRRRATLIFDRDCRVEDAPDEAAHRFFQELELAPQEAGHVADASARAAG
jgi:para-nitrobenzyl esterase